jgi:hypothetical protein
VDITAARRFGIAEKVLQFLGLLADLGYIGLHPQAIVGYKRTRKEKTLPAGKLDFRSSVIVGSVVGVVA